MDRVKRIWYLSPMRAAKVQASLRIRAVSPEPSLLAYTNNESRGIFRQKARSLAPLNGWACAVKICHDGMLEDTNSLDGAQIIETHSQLFELTRAVITLNCMPLMLPGKWTYIHCSCGRHLRLKRWNCQNDDIWASSWDYATYHIGDQRRRRRACASAQSR